MHVDHTILAFLASHRDEPVTWAARAAMAVGTDHAAQAVLVLAGAGVVVLCRWWRVGLAAVLALVSSDLAANGIKALVGRRRPPAALAMVHLGGWSMPSTQAALTAGLAVAVFLAGAWATGAQRRIVAAVLTASVVFIGFCMVYLGGHWPSDVAAGWLLGTGLGAACSWIASQPLPPWPPTLAAAGPGTPGAGGPAPRSGKPARRGTGR